MSANKSAMMGVPPAASYHGREKGCDRLRMRVIPRALTDRTGKRVTPRVSTDPIGEGGRPESAYRPKRPNAKIPELVCIRGSGGEAGVTNTDFQPKWRTEDS